jgi:hypothetical protein
MEKGKRKDLQEPEAVCLIFNSPCVQYRNSLQSRRLGHCLAFLNNPNIPHKLNILKLLNTPNSLKRQKNRSNPRHRLNSFNSEPSEHPDQLNRPNNLNGDHSAV